MESFLLINNIRVLKPMCKRNQTEPAPKLAYLIAFLVILSILLIGCQDQASHKASAMLEKKRLSEQAALKSKEHEERVRVQAQQECTVKRVEYDKLMAARKYWEASLELRTCSETMGDPVLNNLVIDAEVKSHLQDINNPKTPPRDKARAIGYLVRDCPEKGKKYEALVPKLLEQADKEDRAASRSAEVAAVKYRKQYGVEIGMDKEDVLASSWGEPRSKTRTTSAFGTNGTWVYDRGYLYFEKGTLTIIQKNY